jgi:hypothetical protein
MGRFADVPEAPKVSGRGRGRGRGRGCDCDCVVRAARVGVVLVWSARGRGCEGGGVGPCDYATPSGRAFENDTDVAMYVFDA